MQKRYRLGAVAAVAALALTLGACSAGGGGNDSEDRALRVWSGNQTPVEANFNPFSPTALTVMGPVFESLFLFNKAADTEPVGLIGDSYEFNEDGTQLTVTLKDDLKWSDGEDLTADDIVFTFNYEANDPAGIGLVSAEATDDTTAVLTFDSPQFTNVFARLGQTWILPEHVWADVDDFTTFKNEEPVGSGPYVVDSVSAESYTLTANENFRDADDLGVKRVQFVAINDNQTVQDLLAAGEIDWAGLFIPNPDPVTANGKIEFLNAPPQDPTAIYTCSNADLGCTGPQTDLAVRQALNVAVDRATIKEKAFVGRSGDISPAFTLLPRDEKWLGDPANEVSPQEAAPDEAAEILEAAGYVKGSDGFYAKDGVTVEMSLISIDGWTDYNDAAKLIAEEAAAAGIKINASTVQNQEFTDARQTGNYQLIMGGIIGTSLADPYQIYRDWFGGQAVGSTSPVGERLPTARYNYVRYDNPVVDEAIMAATVTDDEALKADAYATIQSEIVRDLPYIPLVVNATQVFYNAGQYTGWPTNDDLYAFPSPSERGQNGYILSQLKPVE